MDQIEFTVCTKDDLDSLHTIALNTFEQTYREKNSPENFQHYLDNSLNKQQLKIELSNPESYFFLVKYQGQVIGYLKLNLGSAQTEIGYPNSLEIERIYLEQSFQGNSFGKQMIHYATSFAQSHGCLFLWLGVWEENHKAIAFYRKMGFVVIGQHEFLLGTDRQQDFIMQCKC